MAKKCKYCFSLLGEHDPVCGVCRIDPARDKKSLDKGEKKIAYWCRSLYTIGFLSIVGGIIGFLGSIGVLASLLTGNTMGLFVSVQYAYVYTIVTMVLAVAFFFFGLALRKHKTGCYVAGIILYSITIIIGVVDRNPIQILFGILFLYYIASATSRKILYRKR